MPATVGRAGRRRAPDRPDIATDRLDDQEWRLWLPDGFDTGVHAETPGQRSGLTHAGENWTNTSLQIEAHTHPGWELYLQLHGSSRWLVDDQPVALASGWAMALPPNTVHGHDPAAGAHHRHHYAYAGFDAHTVTERVPELACVWRGATAIVSSEGSCLQSSFRALIREVAHERPLGGVALQAALDLLLVEAARVLHTQGDSWPRMPGHPAVARAKALLDEDLARPWTLASLSTSVGLSRAHLAALFAAEVGQPPHTYLVVRRLEQAAQLLTDTSRNITAVALEVGFASGSSFARAFRAAHGCSPAQWRRRSTSQRRA